MPLEWEKYFEPDALGTWSYWFDQDDGGALRHNGHGPLAPTPTATETPVQPAVKPGGLISGLAQGIDAPLGGVGTMPDLTPSLNTPLGDSGVEPSFASGPQTPLTSGVGAVPDLALSGPPAVQSDFNQDMTGPISRLARRQR